MTIASEITRITNNIANAYTAIDNKGGELPVSQNSANLATAISSIPSGGSAPVITSLSITPTTSSQTITASGGVDGYSPINVSAVTSSIDNNITAGNIKKDVTILGVTGSYEGSGGGSTTKYGLSIDNIIGDIDTNGTLKKPVGGVNVVFSNVEALGIGALAYKFAYNNAATNVSFPDLITISKNFAMIGCFINSNVRQVTFPVLSSISGVSAMEQCFYMAMKISRVDFSALTNISGNSTTMKDCFASSMGLKDVYFNALTTSSFDSNVEAFKNLFNLITGSINPCTVHFPSNLESTISGLTGYPLFGGISDYIVLAFDLPATS